ncbi:hypothetical protein PsorP6_014095 [Peronosclerospora sorghi]|uniref:Uncharacterized protein n=1 Tax=Peronosclerospora sorghi TaxID=230839 RepID=A0ACC0VHW5_9STRA|nr:hypothetical protein PsorP6_014095 [Peronosclerospora sorghi]
MRDAKQSTIPCKTSFLRQNKNNRVVETVVGFMAKTRCCSDRGYTRENLGVVEATRAALTILKQPSTT